jgi:membrane fusion protein, multidrug efflux system|uniref:efflux RND transporter periplasmic adaptor subunit n=1 Tax=Orrella sp. TaxID=1921583 RepID=UPI0040482E69
MAIIFRMRALTAGLLVGVSVLLSACDKPKPPELPPAKVTVAKPVQQMVQSYQTFDGTAAPLLLVNLDARVPGYLTKINFKDGATVKKDDLLFVIEQAQYKDQVALQQAVYDQAKIEFDRQSTLLQQRATSQAAVDNARSQLQQAQASLSLANLNLSYTEIKAPFDGVMGRHLIDVGNYLGSSPNGIKLAEIRQIDPAYIYFSMNEVELLTYMRMMRSTGQQVQGQAVGNLKVYAALQGDTGYPLEGVLDFAASDLDVSTGTLQLRGLFPNADKRIVPGVYAKVLVYFGNKRDSAMVPSAVVLRDQQGDYLYVLGPENKVQRQNITIGQSYSHLVEVMKGLKADDQVVINGFVTLNVGQTVVPETGKIEPAVLPGAPGAGTAAK